MCEQGTEIGLAASSHAQRTEEGQDSVCLGRLTHKVFPGRQPLPGFGASPGAWPLPLGEGELLCVDTGKGSSISQFLGHLCRSLTDCSSGEKGRGRSALPQGAAFPEAEGKQCKADIRAHGSARTWLCV